MKKIVILAMTVLSLFAETLPWAKSFDEAKKQAAASHKMVMVMLSQEGCEMCDYMKYVVFKNPEVITAVDARFIPVEIDIHKGKVPDGMRAFGTPTFYFTDENGNKIGRQMVGGAAPASFIDALGHIHR